MNTRSLPKAFTMPFPLMVLFLVGAVSLLGTVSTASAQNNPPAGQISGVQSGVITSMQPITSQGKGSVGGTLVGGAAGGLLGNQVGGGSGKKAATAAGAIFGARAGNKRSANRNTQQNVEFLIKLDNGQKVAVVQSQAAASGFRNGDRVNVIVGPDGTTRITRG